VRRLFFILSAVTVLVIGVAAAKDSHDRNYLNIQDQYKADYHTSDFDTKIQQLFPSFALARQGDTFRTERCISCHVPDIGVVGPQVAAKRLAQDFFKYEPDADQIAKDYGLASKRNADGSVTTAHPTLITQDLYNRYGADSVATTDGFHPYLVQGDNGKSQPAQLNGFIPSFLSPAASGGKPTGIDNAGCISCHNGSRLALDENSAHKNLIINPEYSFTAGASLYYQYCASCHGNVGEGKIGPPLSNQDRLGFFNEDYYYRCIEYGMTDFEHYGSVMPNWGSIASDWGSFESSRDKQRPNPSRVLSEPQIHLLVQFVRHWESYQTLP